MADRQEFQQERSRLLRDPEAGDDTQIGDAAGEGFGVTQEPAETDAPIDGVPSQYDPARTTTDGPGVTASAPPQEYQQPEVEVTAAIVDDGIAVTFLIPHGLIGVALSR